MREHRSAVETEIIADGDRDRAPLAVRRAAWLLLGGLLAGAGYLIAVRRDAILVDLANFAAWCF